MKTIRVETGLGPEAAATPVECSADREEREQSRGYAGLHNCFCDTCGSQGYVIRQVVR